MGRHSAEGALPPVLLGRASLVGNEYAWRVDDIPNVIEAARAANLVSIGGQLQFRLPDGGTCECYWVQVDTYQSVDRALPWKVRVERTAISFAALGGKLRFGTGRQSEIRCQTRKHGLRRRGRRHAETS